MGMNVGAHGGKKRGARPEMNVTPLVDVVLVLLIIFMVIMPIMPAHFWVHVPDKPDSEDVTPPDPNEKQPLLVSVNAEGGFQINKEVVPDAEFVDKLRRVLIARGERKVFFDAADNAPYSRAVRALDLARVGGAAHIAVLTEGVHD
ncbi:MAG: biopolymer transporter ExbD [Myxococcales bacterium]|nr:MAG: biopolymer transporter ExbD [Myxococcales bacterium]